jgi:hypothetical protein
MNPVAILVLADTQTHGDLGRVVNAMMVAKELKEGGDDVQLNFDGAGTQWPGELSNSNTRRIGCSNRCAMSCPAPADTVPARSTPRMEWLTPT